MDFCRLARALSAVALAAAGLFVAAMPVEAAPVTTRAEMAAYIRQMAPLHAKTVKAEQRLSAAQLGYLGGRVTEAQLDAAARAFKRDLRDAYLGMKGVKPPAVLRSPHAGFLLTVKTEFSASQGELERRSREMSTLRAHWREEVIFQLRRAGLAVPLWIKRLRWNF
jgi:hypothetical protein